MMLLHMKIKVCASMKPKGNKVPDPHLFHSLGNEERYFPPTGNYQNEHLR
jgi:hypothetical protein